MPNPKNGAKSVEKIPALKVFGRIRGSNVNQAAVFLEKDAKAAKKAALDAGLSSLEVTAEEHRRAAALPKGAITTAKPKGHRGNYTLAFICPGDPLLCVKLDRLGRSTRDVLNLVHELDQKGANRAKSSRERERNERR
jgi:hypothetical protein